MTSEKSRLTHLQSKDGLTGSLGQTGRLGLIGSYDEEFEHLFRTGSFICEHRMMSSIYLDLFVYFC